MAYAFVFKKERNGLHVKFIGFLCCGRHQSFCFALKEDNSVTFKVVLDFTLNRHSCFQPAGR